MPPFPQAATFASLFSVAPVEGGSSSSSNSSIGGFAAASPQAEGLSFLRVARKGVLQLAAVAPQLDPDLDLTQGPEGEALGGGPSPADGIDATPSGPAAASEPEAEAEGAGAAAGREETAAAQPEPSSSEESTTTTTTITTTAAPEPTGTKEATAPEPASAAEEDKPSASAGPTAAEEATPALPMPTWPKPYSANTESVTVAVRDRMTHSRPFLLTHRPGAPPEERGLCITTAKLPALDGQHLIVGQVSRVVVGQVSRVVVGQVSIRGKHRSGGRGAGEGRCVFDV